MNVLKPLDTRKKRVAIVAVATVAVVGIPALLAIGKWASEPSQTTIRLAGATTAQTEKPTYQPVHNAFFSTVVPSGWQVQTTTDAASAGRLHVIASAPDGSLGQVAITCDTLPDGGLAQIADYHLRTSEPNQYPAFHAAYLPAGSKAFRSAQDNTNYTVFLTRNTHFASVTVGGTTSAQAALTLLRATIIQWSWSSTS